MNSFKSHFYLAINHKLAKFSHFPNIHIFAFSNTVGRTIIFSSYPISNTRLLANNISHFTYMIVKVMGKYGPMITKCEGETLPQ